MIIATFFHNRNVTKCSTLNSVAPKFTSGF